MGWEHYQTVDPLKKEPQVRRGLFGVCLLILHFKFQFSKSIKPSTFRIFLNLTYPLRKNISFTKCPKITQKIYTKPWNIGECSKRRDLALLEMRTRYWHKGHVERRENSLQVKSRLNFQHLHLIPLAIKVVRWHALEFPPGATRQDVLNCLKDFNLK